MLRNPYIILALVVGLTVSHSFVFYKGHEYAQLKATKEINKAQEEKIRAMYAYDVASRELVKAYQNKEVETKIVYKTIKERVKDETTGHVCFNDGAVSVWNNALEGVLPETSTGVVEETSRAYSDEEVLSNAVENFEQYNSCREQLNALIDWHEKN